MPRLIDPEESLKTYKKYWWESQEQAFSVVNVEKIDGREYYFISTKNYSHCMSLPLDTDTYELKRATQNSLNKNIINNGSYPGYHIKWWLFMNKDKSKYKYFLPFVTMDSKYCIQDDRIYSLKGKLEFGVYKDCRVILEKRQLW
jgi:hypothetical protein